MGAFNLFGWVFLVKAITLCDKSDVVNRFTLVLF